MNKFCTIQIYQDNQWQDCAIVELLADESLGWEAKSRTSYLFEYALTCMDQQDAHALSYNFAVNVQNYLNNHWPAFLIDLLPQGYGRQELLRQLNFSENTQQKADWKLLNAGAGNTIGHLRIKEAYQWLNQNFPITQQQGFTLKEIIARSESFIESLASYGLFVGGSSGVQGEWPKLLLTQGYDDLFYLDHTITDQNAKKHWLVKFSRGENPRLAKILANEAHYMQLAKFLNLRVYADLEFYAGTLFIPRFDRQVQNGKVLRFAQESIASLSAQTGFGIKLSHNQICQLLFNSCTDPLTEIIEYLKRDLANVALGNKDNHTRNTAIQRFNDGLIQLSPLFDFAPMWLHPDGIARTTRWENHDQGGSPNWKAVLQQIHEITQFDPHILTHVLKQQFSVYSQLVTYMQSIGVDAEIINNSQPRIDMICQQLEQL